MRARRRTAQLRTQGWNSVQLYDETYNRMDSATKRRFLESRIEELDREIARGAWPDRTVAEIPRRGAQRVDRAEQARFACMYALHELLQSADSSRV